MVLLVSFLPFVMMMNEVLTFFSIYVATETELYIAYIICLCYGTY